MMCTAVVAGVSGLGASGSSAARTGARGGGAGASERVGVDDVLTATGRMAETEDTALTSRWIALGFTSACARGT
jgi:hypothetical protein